MNGIKFLKCSQKTELISEEDWILMKLVTYIEFYFTLDDRITIWYKLFPYIMQSKKYPKNG